MKTLTFISAAFIASTCCISARASDSSLNPDRFVSIGVNVQKYAASGGQTDLTGPYPGLQMTERGSGKESSNDVAVNLRIPTSNSLTLDLTYVDVRGVRHLERSGGMYVSDLHLEGYRASVGLRYYFNR